MTKSINKYKMSKRMDSWSKVGSVNKKDEYYTPEMRIHEPERKS